MDEILGDYFMNSEINLTITGVIPFEATHVQIDGNSHEIKCMTYRHGSVVTMTISDAPVKMKPSGRSRQAQWKRELNKRTYP